MTPAPAPPVPAPATPVVDPASQHRPDPVPAQPEPVAPAPPAAASAPPVVPPTAAPAPAAAPSPRVADDVDTATEPTEVFPTVEPTDQFQAVDASVVPVPIESLNRLVLAVDELGTEMAYVRQAIRDLTAALSESQAHFAQLLAIQPGAPDAPDPLTAVRGPYVSGAPTPTPFPTEQAPAFTAPAPPASAPPAPEPPAPPTPAAVPFSAPAPAPETTNGTAVDPAHGLTPEHLSELGDLPIVSTGAVQVVIGPIASLDELDAAVEHIGRITGIDSVAVTSFEGPHVVLTTELTRPLPLASLLRNSLGREVASCRLVDGRIVVDFGEAGRQA